MVASFPLLPSPKKTCWLKGVEILEYFHEGNHDLKKLAEEEAGCQSTCQPGRTMQGHFYFTQQQLSGFAVAFPLDSICNSDWLWLLHVVYSPQKSWMWEQARAGGRPKLWPIAPIRRHQEGLACLHRGAATHSQAGRALHPQHISKINGSTRITWALGSTPTKIVCLAKSRLFHAFLSWKCIKHILDIH